MAYDFISFPGKREKNCNDFLHSSAAAIAAWHCTFSWIKCAARKWIITFGANVGIWYDVGTHCSESVVPAKLPLYGSGAKSMIDFGART